MGQGRAGPRPCTPPAPPPKRLQRESPDRQGPSRRAPLGSPGRPEPRPAAHPAPPASPPTAGRGGGRKTHADEAVQLPHGHLLGPLHGLQDLLLVLGVAGGEGAQESPPSARQPHLPGHALRGPSSSLTFFFFASGSYFPDQGSNPCPLPWDRGVLTTGPPGKPLFSLALCSFFLSLSPFPFKIMKQTDKETAFKCSSN